MFTFCLRDRTLLQKMGLEQQLKGFQLFLAMTSKSSGLPVVSQPSLIRELDWKMIKNPCHCRIAPRCSKKRLCAVSLKLHLCQKGPTKVQLVCGLPKTNVLTFHSLGPQKIQQVCGVSQMFPYDQPFNQKFFGEVRCHLILRSPNVVHWLVPPSPKQPQQQLKVKKLQNKWFFCADATMVTITGKGNNFPKFYTCDFCV